MELEGDKRASSGLSESDDVNNKSQTDSPKHPNLSDAQRAKIERNRQKALLLRQARLTSRPYPTEKPSRKSDKPEVSGIKVSGRLIDTGAGFLLEEETEDEKNQESLKIVEQPAPIIDNRPRCEECGNLFSESFLLNHYDVDICDTCRDNEERHALITKTDAKQHYLLKDCDFDKREPPLKFIVRKNPHNARWGDMRLFLKSQVEARALQVWGSKEKIEEQKEKRSVNKEKLKQKKFDKKMKELRREVRSSLWTKDISSHEHTYGEETYNEESDMYSKSCTSCGHHLTYEKM
ncbi:DNA repair protein complementing XP-A cells homolog [Ptychodera flava]|uniref:DNA repair protein complementing XP-A cells homolog n=1 Tax=Ptychodera flava TaxID=63121 RepID=UPI00396A0159